MKHISVEQIDCDVRAEVVAANFVQNVGVPIDKLSINNRGSRERRYRKDILNVEYRTTKLGFEDILNIDVSRSGIYDLLPQGFFHGDANPDKKRKKNTAEIIDDFKLHREEEEAVRTFFLPVEREINRLRITLELSERKALLGLSDDHQNELFVELFPEILEVAEIHRLAVIQVLPIVHRIRGNRDLIAPLLSFLFNLPARAVALNQFSTVPNKGELNTLGVNSYIGQSFVIGNYIPDYSPEFVIEVGPMKKSDALKFQPGGEFDKLVVFIKKYLIPFDSEIKINLIFHKNEKGLYLSDSESTDRIGLNTYL